MQLLRGGTAEASGLIAAGDEIIAVDGEDVRCTTAGFIRRKIIGHEGTTVVLGLYRRTADGTAIEFAARLRRTGGFNRSQAAVALAEQDALARSVVREQHKAHAEYAAAKRDRMSARAGRARSGSGSSPHKDGGGDAAFAKAASEQQSATATSGDSDGARPSGRISVEGEGNGEAHSTSGGGLAVGGYAQRKAAPRPGIQTVDLKLTLRDRDERDDHVYRLCAAPVAPVLSRRMDARWLAFAP